MNKALKVLWKEKTNVTYKENFLYETSIYAGKVWL